MRRTDIDGTDGAYNAALVINGKSFPVRSVNIKFPKGKLYPEEVTFSGVLCPCKQEDFP